MLLWLYPNAMAKYVDVNPTMDWFWCIVLAYTIIKK
jgi:hypothetical protein